MACSSIETNDLHPLRFCSHFSPPPPPIKCKTISEFDTHVTVPTFGYSSLEEYYSAGSNWDKVHRIWRPLLCITAADDPFVPKECEL